MPHCIISLNWSLYIISLWKLRHHELIISCFSYRLLIKEVFISSSSYWLFIKISWFTSYRDFINIFLWLINRGLLFFDCFSYWLWSHRFFRRLRYFTLLRIFWHLNFFASTNRYIIKVVWGFSRNRFII